MSSYAITGAPTNGTLPVRQEIRQLQKNADLWNLYLLGLSRFQSVPQNNQLSYYQIAGIHGRPFIAWDNVGASADGWHNGYCTHTSNLFPTWHRPYLALYEQALYNIIQTIAREYTNPTLRAKYVAAAKNFRIPYWDWAAAPPSGDNTFPLAVWQSQTVSVVVANGSTTSIKNPLYSYKFNPLSTKDFPQQPFSVWQETVRYPSSGSPSATSRNNLVDAQVANNRLALRDGLHTLFTAYDQFDNFSNKAWIPSDDGNNYISIESLHDQIHGLVGNRGHMSVVDYSAFDPVFWLHHTMVDRAVALWQVIYPDSYVVAHEAQGGTFTIAEGDTEDDQSPLTPFHADTSGNFWTSDAVRSTQTFGYTYPELVDTGLTTQQVQSNVKAAIEQLYGRNPVPPQKAKKSGIFGIFDGPGDEPESAHKHGEHEHHEHHGIRDILEDLGVVKDNKYNEYFANIRVKKYALNGSFFVHIFVGPFDKEPFQWSFEPGLVGSHCVFVNDPDSTECGKCKMDHTKNMIVTGSIPLTTTLLDAVKNGKLKSLDFEDVDPYLKENLHWRVTTMEDVEVPRESVDGLKVSVVSSEVTKPSHLGEFPRFGKFQVHLDITHGRPCGFSHGDRM